MRKTSISAALIKQRSRIVIHLNSGKRERWFACLKMAVPWLVEHCAELGVIFAHRSDRAVQSETIRPSQS